MPQVITPGSSSISVLNQQNSPKISNTDEQIHPRPQHLHPVKENPTATEDQIKKELQNPAFKEYIRILTKEEIASLVMKLSSKLNK